MICHIQQLSKYMRICFAIYFACFIRFFSLCRLVLNSFLIPLSFTGVGGKWLAFSAFVAQNQMQSQRTALILAATERHADCVRVLIEGGANMDSKGNVRFFCIVLHTSGLLCIRAFDSDWLRYFEYSHASLGR